MVAAPSLERLFWQEERTTRQVTVIHHSPARPNQDPHHRFPYTVVSPVFQVTGQVRFRPLSALDLERTVADIDKPGMGISRPDAIQKVKFAFPHDSSYKGLQNVGFTNPTTQ
jgi:hypothetical protein